MQSFSANVLLISVLYLLGIAIPNTLEQPKALTEIAATKAESTPPEIPITTFENPFFNT